MASSFLNPRWAHDDIMMVSSLSAVLLADGVLTILSLLLALLCSISATIQELLMLCMEMKTKEKRNGYVESNSSDDSKWRGNRKEHFFYIPERQEHLDR